MNDEELETYLYDALLEDWPGFPPEQRARYAAYYPERVARAGVSMDDPYVPKVKPPMDEATLAFFKGWQTKPMTDEEFEASFVADLKDDWPTLTRKKRRSYAERNPERVAKAGVSIDDPYTRAKSTEYEA